MMQITPQMRILVATAPADFRKGIDGLARVCREALSADPFSGTVFVFRNRSATAIKILAYDGQGFWLCQKRLSQGRLHYWPGHGGVGRERELLAHELQVLLAGGDPEATGAAPQWRRVVPLTAGSGSSGGSCDRSPAVRRTATG
ncbi:MAG TPA: IS66 family insertion sequence element accessory protein TnpB [Thermoanaerobaculia bacterium]|nr:IS66 family insertion sequence element accessory protein TnpB [Thermoanaerobaculia bacterium]